MACYFTLGGTTMMSNILCEQNHGILGAKPHIHHAFTWRENDLLISFWLLSKYFITFNNILHEYKD